jgi:NADH-quinone oxidoreductase subunit M
LQGVVVQMVAHGISAGALFILCGQLYERLHTRDLRQMGGLWARIAWLPAITLFFAAASLGLPGLGNFVGEFLILLGAFKNYPWIVSIATGGLILAVVYSLMMIQKAFYGATPSDASRTSASQQNAAQHASQVQGLSMRELGLMLVMMTALLVLGFFPQPILNISEPPMQSVLNFYSVAGK